MPPPIELFWIAAAFFTIIAMIVVPPFVFDFVFGGRKRLVAGRDRGIAALQGKLAAARKAEKKAFKVWEQFCRLMKAALNSPNDYFDADVGAVDRAVVAIAKLRSGRQDVKLEEAADNLGDLFPDAMEPHECVRFAIGEIRRLRDERVKYVGLGGTITRLESDLNACTLIAVGDFYPPFPEEPQAVREVRDLRRRYDELRPAKQASETLDALKKGITALAQDLGGAARLDVSTWTETVERMRQEVKRLHKNASDGETWRTNLDKECAKLRRDLRGIEQVCRGQEHLIQWAEHEAVARARSLWGDYVEAANEIGRLKVSSVITAEKAIEFLIKAGMIAITDAGRRTADGILWPTPSNGGLST